MCVVTNKSEGLIITAYITDRIKKVSRYGKKKLNIFTDKKVNVPIEVMNIKFYE